MLAIDIIGVARSGPFVLVDCIEFIDIEGTSDICWKEVIDVNGVCRELNGCWGEIADVFGVC